MVSLQIQILSNFDLNKIKQNISQRELKYIKENIFSIRYYEYHFGVLNNEKTKMYEVVYAVGPNTITY